MKRFYLAVMVLSLSCVAFGQWTVRYVGGTLDHPKVGTIAGLILSPSASMQLEAADRKITIPYDRIVSYQYCEEVAHHLGVLPAIAVGLLKQRQHKHVFTIVYLDDRSTRQIVVFEVPKQAAHSVQAVLDAKGVHSCLQYQPCSRNPGTRPSGGSLSAVPSS